MVAYTYNHKTGGFKVWNQWDPVSKQQWPEKFPKIEKQQFERKYHLFLSQFLITFFFSSAGDRTQGIPHVRLVLYHWALAPASFILGVSVPSRMLPGRQAGRQAKVPEGSNGKGTNRNGHKTTPTKPLATSQNCCNNSLDHPVFDLRTRQANAAEEPCYP